MNNEFYEEVQRLRGVPEYDGEDNDAAVRRAIAVEQL